MRELELMGHLIQFLGRYSWKELEAANRAVHGPGWLHECLHVLTSTRRQFEEHTKRNGGFRLEFAIQARSCRPRPYAHAETQLDRSIEDRILSLVHDREMFKSNADLCSYLSHQGLGPGFRPKDGRKRIANRVLRVLASLGPERQRKLLARLFRMLPESETAGWFKAIRGR